MAQDAGHYIFACTVCARGKSSHQTPTGFLHPLGLPHCPWMHIAVDFVVDLPESHGNTVIMSIVDQFSRIAHFIPIAKLPSAAETGELLVQDIFRLHRPPWDVVSDRGPQFTSQGWKSFCAPPFRLMSGHHLERTGGTDETKVCKAPSGA